MEPKEMERVPVDELAQILTASDAFRGQQKMEFSFRVSESVSMVRQPAGTGASQ
jgi:hypothetical protein